MKNQKIKKDHKKIISKMVSEIDTALLKMNINGFVATKKVEDNVICIIEVKKIYTDVDGNTLDVQVQ